MELGPRAAGVGPYPFMANWPDQDKENTWNLGAGAKLLSLLRDRLGHENVGFSQEGFNAG